MRLAPLLALAGLVLALSGCGGYRLGPSNGERAGARSLQITPFANKTPEPRLIEAITASLRKSVQQDGTYRLGTDGASDIIVSGDIVKFEREYLSFQPRDVVTPRDYRLAIVSHVTARERLSGKILLERDVRGHSTIRTGVDLNSAERQAIPLVAEDLARNITALLVDGTW